MNTLKNADQNAVLLQKKVEARSKIEGPRVGDYLKLPYGIYTRFTHDWGDTIQTGGGSFYLYNSGQCDFSGSLDSGIKTADIVLTNETRMGRVWFFDKEVAGAGRGIDFEIEFRVYEPIEGANLTGCPQVREYEKQQVRNRAETITRINGNGQPYTQPLPELLILSKRDAGRMASEPIPEHVKVICREHGSIVADWDVHSITVQPLTTEAMCNIIGAHPSTTQYYNNSHHNNTLIIQLK